MIESILYAAVLVAVYVRWVFQDPRTFLPYHLYQVKRLWKERTSIWSGDLLRAKERAGWFGLDYWRSKR